MSNSATENEATQSPSDEVQAELDYLRYFYQEADFGPAHGDVMYIINEIYEGEIPEGYRAEEDES